MDVWRVWSSYNPDIVNLLRWWCVIILFLFLFFFYKFTVKLLFLSCKIASFFCYFETSVPLILVIYSAYFEVFFNVNHHHHYYHQHQLILHSGSSLQIVIWDFLIRNFHVDMCYHSCLTSLSERKASFVIRIAWFIPSWIQQQ